MALLAEDNVSASLLTGDLLTDLVFVLVEVVRFTA